MNAGAVEKPVSDGGCLGAIDVAVLAGGLGSRISAVLGDTPKILAPINGRPYLDHLLDRLRANGARRVVLCLGHLAEKVRRHLDGHQSGGIEIELVIENEPLGTGGALALAMRSLASDPVMVMNGDTWIDTDLGAFAESHLRSGLEASILCVRVDDVSAYGGVEVDARGHLERFVEKDPRASGPGSVNGGIYLFSQALLDDLGASAARSLERDFLEKLPPGTIHGYLAEDARFVDIGTPEGLTRAGEVIGMGGRPR